MASEHPARDGSRGQDAPFGEARLRVLVDSVPAMIAYVDTGERFVFCNRAYLQAFGVTEPAALGKTIREVVGDATYEAVQPLIARALAGHTARHERSQRWPGGGSSELSVTYVPHFGEDGRVLGFHSLLVDITERKRAEEALRASEARMRAISDNLPALVAYVDASETYQFANRTYEEWFGLRPEQVVGRTMNAVLRGDYAKAKPHIGQALAGQLAVHDREVYINNERRHLHNIYIPHFGADGATVGFSILATDISERKALEHELSHRASHDALTGLPNRTLFRDRLEQALERAKRHGTPLAVMYLDIDRFKAVNDTLGHQVGDELLKGFAERLVRYVRTTDTVARLGGGEFVILLEEIGTEADALLVADKVIAGMQPGFRLAGAFIPATASIGLAMLAPGSFDADALLARADAALYRAKAEGRNRCCTAP